VPTTYAALLHHAGADELDTSTLDLCVSGGAPMPVEILRGFEYEHPAVREAAVVGVPHESLGDEVAAAVSLKEGADTSPDELRDYVKQRLAAYKYPRTVVVLDDLPKTPTGKILKREIEVPGRDRPG
jgi:long-chain acyl-CoA synthetase